MVARSPRNRLRETAPPLSPTLLRDMVKKVDKCVARLQELQHTVAGGRKVISGVSLSPRSTRTYLKTSVRCKEELLRIKTAIQQRSPPGKLPRNADQEWRRMSLPGMLLGETMGEIMQTSQFARNIVGAVASKTKKAAAIDDPRTPPMERRKQKQMIEHSELHARRKREKQVVLQTKKSESDDVQRAKSRINFKTSSPLQKTDCDKENCRFIVNKVSPRNRPWARKTVLFPNPLFHPSAQHQKFSEKTNNSPAFSRKNRGIPHKFLIKSPPPCASKFQVKIKSHPLCVSPTIATTTTASLLVKKSPKASNAAKLRRSFSPSRLAKRLVSPMRNTRCVEKIEGASAAVKQRRSFSPSRVVNRLVSPLKSRKSELKNGVMSGLKQRPMSMSVQLSPRRI